MSTETTANPAATTSTALSNRLICKTSKLLLDVYNSGKLSNLIFSILLYLDCDSFSYDDQLNYNEQIALLGPGTDDNCDLVSKMISMPEKRIVIILRVLNIRVSHG